MILVAYMDESGTHGGDGTPANPASPVTIMAGVMGTAGQWQRFLSEYSRLRRKHRFNIFHAKDVAHKAGEFRGWKDAQCISLINDLFDIVDAPILMDRLTFQIDNDKYLSDFRQGENPKGCSLDTAYGLCFRNIVLHFSIELQRRLGHHKSWAETRLHFVLEEGHRHAGDAIRVFGELRQEYVAIGSDLLGQLSELIYVLDPADLMG